MSGKNTIICSFNFMYVFFYLGSSDDNKETSSDKREGVLVGSPPHMIGKDRNLFSFNFMYFSVI
jgi:hypothetical protein